jgi:hypothetical protein
MAGCFCYFRSKCYHCQGVFRNLYFFTPVRGCNNICRNWFCYCKGERFVIQITQYVPELGLRLPSTLELLRSSNLVVHESVSAIILHGSRGLKGGARPDSDIDLSLTVDIPLVTDSESRVEHLHSVSETTLRHWKGPVELDLAVVFDMRSCGLKCFEWTAWDAQSCFQGGRDCFGLYKIQKGFSGLVTGAGVQVKLMYPCWKIWSREASYHWH